MSLRIERLWAWVSRDNPGGDEGIVGKFNPVDRHWVPLIGADEERLRSLRSAAEEAAEISGQPVHLVRFDVRTDVDVIKPRRRPQ